MKVGLALPVFDFATGRPLRIAELAALAQEAESVGFDSLWLMDHYRLDNVPRTSAGHEPFITLAYLAGITERPLLGTLVACNGFRGVGQLARQAASLADASDGRFVLGLGAGWQRSEFTAFGHPFARRASRLEETLEVLPGLMRGETLTHEGERVRLRGASVTATVAPPPVWVAGFRPRMMSIAARFADGWNSAWHGPDTTRFRGELARLRVALEQAGRASDQFEISVGLWMLPVAGDELAHAVLHAESLKPASADALWPSPVAETMLTGDPSALAAAAGSYLDAGGQHLIFNLSVTPFSLFDRSYIGRVAPVLALLRARELRSRPNSEQPERGLPHSFGGISPPAKTMIEGGL